MPVVEAMACGCPVITTREGSLGEIAGDAALFVSGKDPTELARAMTSIRNPVARHDLIEGGLRQAAGYDWEIMTQQLCRLFKRAYEEGQGEARKRFFAEWERL